MAGEVTTVIQNTNHYLIITKKKYDLTVTATKNKLVLMTRASIFEPPFFMWVDSIFEFRT